MNNPGSNSRNGLFQILHALFWAFALLFADAIWGEASWGAQIVPWMVVAYVVTNELLLAFTGRKQCAEDR